MQIISKHQQDIERKMISAGMPKKAVIREMSFAKQLFDASPYLQGCDANSILSAIVNVANVGLTLNPAARESYIVPRYNSSTRSTEATLMPSYIGLIKLIINEGNVTSIVAQMVYEKDEFAFEPTNILVPVIHKSNPFADRGKPIGVYAVATLKDGTRQAEAMSIGDIETIRNNSESYKNEKTRSFSPWVNHFDEMARKTVIRRIFKYLPRGGNQAQVLNNALELDNQDQGASFQQIEFIYSLLGSSTLAPERIDRIERQMEGFTHQEAKDCIAYLKENQQEEIDPAKQFKNRS